MRMCLFLKMYCPISLRKKKINIQKIKQYSSNGLFGFLSHLTHHYWVRKDYVLTGIRIQQCWFQKGFMYIYLLLTIDGIKSFWLFLQKHMQEKFQYAQLWPHVASLISNKAILLVHSSFGGKCWMNPHSPGLSLI